MLISPFFPCTVPVFASSYCVSVSDSAVEGIVTVRKPLNGISDLFGVLVEVECPKLNSRLTIAGVELGGAGLKLSTAVAAG